MTVADAHSPVTESERLREQEFPTEQQEAGRPRARRAPRSGLSIQSKLLIMLLTVVRSRPLLAQEIGRSIELKRKLAADALATAGVVRGTLGGA